MHPKKRILLKITGMLLEQQHAPLISAVIDNLITLRNTHQFGIVIGGGNFFRGHQHGKALGMSPAAGHSVGMLATLMNGIIFKDRLLQAGIPAKLLSAVPCDTIAHPINQDLIDSAQAHDDMLIFAGGTGNPFFTTDTNAILRALQMDAHEVWKATNVDGIYSADPRTNPDATFIPHLTHQEALDRALGIMDATALTLAQAHKVSVRVFNLLKPNALLAITQSPDIGSIIETKGYL
jgi:uridylate kinase